MELNSQSIIKEQFARLPQAVRDAITKTNIRAKLLTIAKNNDLRIDQTGAVEDETMLVMLGLEHPDQFVSNIVRNANISQNIATRIAIDVNEFIFKEVRHLLVEMHDKDANQERAAQQFDALAPVQPPTPQVRTIGTDIAQIKASGSVHLPPDSVKVKEEPPSPVMMPSQQRPFGSAQGKPQVPGRGYSTGTDPYREPVR